MSNSEVGQLIGIFSYPVIGYISFLKLGGGGRGNLGAKQKSGEGHGPLCPPPPLESPLILGPMLYLIFVNDFQNGLNCSNAIMYADDTSLYISDKNVKKLPVVENSNKELARVDDWLIANNKAANSNLNSKNRIF